MTIGLGGGTPWIATLLNVSLPTHNMIEPKKRS